jgi:hypothetical protein
MKDYVIKSLKETFACEPRAEIHLAGCSHLKRNVLQTSRILKAENVEQILKEYVDYDNSDRDDYRIAPCTK